MPRIASMMRRCLRLVWLVLIAGCTTAAPQTKVVDADLERAEAQCMTEAGCRDALAEVQAKNDDEGARSEMRRCFMTGLVTGALEACDAITRDHGQFAAYGCAKTKELLGGDAECTSLIDSQAGEWAGPKGKAYAKAVADLQIGVPERRVFWYAFDGGYAYAWRDSFVIAERPDRVIVAIHDGCSFAIDVVTRSRRVDPVELQRARSRCDDLAHDFVEQNRAALLQ